MDTLTLTKLILAFTLVGDLCLFLFLLKEKRSIKKLIFAIFIVGITGWTAAIFINLWAQSYTVEKLIFGFAAIFLTAQVFFAQLFSNKLQLHVSLSGGVASRQILWLISTYWSVPIGAFFLIISFWNGAVFSSLEYSPQGYTIVENGFLSGVYSLFALAFAAAPIVILLWALIRTNDSLLRVQLKHLVFGFSIFLGVNIFTNSVLPVFFHIFFFDAIGPVLSLVLAGFVFYIIWRYEFLDIHIIKDLLNKERIRSRELEEKVRERTADMEKLLTQERQLMQDISHAQQTSLTILRADVEQLRQKHIEEIAPVLEAMEQGINRSSSLMYELLRAAHLEMQATRNHKTVDLSALARKVVEYVDIICNTNNLSLTHHIESNISIVGDEKQLEELFVTLLSNSVKYKKPNVPGTITLTLTHDEGSIILSIADTGIGIAEEHLPLIFERFYRAHTGEGNGLGLAIAKAIAEAHNGTISVQSIESEGSEFTVYFPK